MGSGAYIANTGCYRQRRIVAHRKVSGVDVQEYVVVSLYFKPRRMAGNCRIWYRNGSAAAVLKGANMIHPEVTAIYRHIDVYLRGINGWCGRLSNIPGDGYYIATIIYDAAARLAGDGKGGTCIDHVQMYGVVREQEATIAAIDVA